MPFPETELIGFSHIIFQKTCLVINHIFHLTKVKLVQIRSTRRQHKNSLM
ncbi:MAG: hypothetical protein KC587_12115 [Nitrospira sp.]|nr:hypothetical protein [Nitrospira sp.]MCA9457401.1 hypothetical protein [Nitrospira sp.]MCW5782703.1 hypothetical protein [Nitrospirales bacterium]